MRRYLRIVARVSLANLRARLAYRTEFLLAVCNGVLWQTSVLVFAGVLLTRFPGLGGWPAGGVLLIAGVRLLSHALYVLVFSNVTTVPLLVQEGRLDGYLLRPVPAYSQVLLNGLSVNALGDLTVALTLCAVAVGRLDLRWTPGRVAFLGTAIVGAVLLEAAVQTAIACLALRHPGASVLSLWLDEIMATFGNYPLNIFPGAVRGLLTYVVPLAFLAYLPAAAIIGRAGATGTGTVLVWLSPAAGPLAFLAARLLWSRSLRRYQGVGG